MAEPKSTFDRARSYIAKMDPAIEKSGGDHQTFTVACRLVNFGLSQSEAETLFKEYNLRCQPPWPEKKLLRKLKHAFSKASPKKEFCEPSRLASVPYVEKQANDPPKWPEPSKEAMASIIAEQGGFSVADLWESSPVRLEEPPRTEHILPVLFPGDPLVCVGASKFKFWTRKLSILISKASEMQFIVPNPMTMQFGVIQDVNEDGSPKFSEHSIDNTGDRVYAVIESDEGSSDEHAAILNHLKDFSPLVMVVNSGGKSLHGWFHVEHESEADIFKFYRYARFLGADRATFVKSQFVRMPDGLRDNGNRQCVYYFNPANIKAKT